MVNDINKVKHIEYDIDGVKVKVTRESNNNSRSLLDCLLDLYLKQQCKLGEINILNEVEEPT